MPTARDLFPEYDLVPTTYYRIPIFRFQSKFDYVQNLERNNKADSFHVLCKKSQDGSYKFGVLFYQRGCLRSICEEAIDVVYDKVNFLGDTTGKSITIITERNSKYGLHIWRYGNFINHEQVIPPVFDCFIYEPESKQFRAIKGQETCYYDMTGHLLK